nr:hypothetical protein [Tanacetum cinerariifolium]
MPNNTIIKSNKSSYIGAHQVRKNTCSGEEGGAEGEYRGQCEGGSNVAKNLKKLSQAPRGVSVGPKTLNLASKEANSSGSSFWNVRSSSFSATPIVEKIDKLERLIIDEKLTRVDNKRKPLEKVDYPGDHDSEDEVKLVDSEMASFLALKMVDFGTTRLLEYWKKTYENAHYDYDPYGDDMYEGQEIHDIIQSMCDNLDIKVRGRKKK